MKLKYYLVISAIFLTFIIGYSSLANFASHRSAMNLADSNESKPDTDASSMQQKNPDKPVDSQKSDDSMIKAEKNSDQVLEKEDDQKIKEEKPPVTTE